MSGRLTGYICTWCGFIIIELKPVSPICPDCAMYNWYRGKMVEVNDVGEVKFMTVMIHLTEIAGPIQYREPRPATD